MQSRNVSVTWENTGSDTKVRELAIKGSEAVQDDFGSWHVLSHLSTIMVLESAKVKHSVGSLIGIQFLQRTFFSSSHLAL